MYIIPELCVFRSCVNVIFSTLGSSVITTYVAVLGVQYPFLSGALRYVCDMISPCLVIALSILGTIKALLYSTLTMNTSNSRSHLQTLQIRDHLVQIVHGLLSHYILHLFLNEFVDPGQRGQVGQKLPSPYSTLS